MSQPSYEFTHARFTVEALAADSGRGDFESARFSGLAVRFDSPIETHPIRTMFRRGAFKKTIAQNGPRIKILNAHDTATIPIGVPIELRRGSRL